MAVHWRAGTAVSYLVAQLGARMHYGVPRALHAAGMLDRLVTDIYLPSTARRLDAALPLGVRPRALRRLAGRHASDLPPRLVTAFTGLGLAYQARLLLARSDRQYDAAHLWMGEKFGREVARLGFGAASGVYAYETAALGVLTAARRQGLHTVLEQTNAPKKVRDELLHDDRRSFPSWMMPAPDSEVARALMARESQEWEVARLIVCGSEFVREGIAACGGPVDRCVVIPYGVESRFGMAPRARHDGPLRVLVAGRVGLRKGSPYVAAAARRLTGRVTVRMIGPLDIPPAVAAELSEVVTLAGAVPRAEMRAQFAWADVFLLPSICEGSATVIYEAMAASLPVICTANTGSVVRDGVDGIIVPLRDVDGIVAALELLAGAPELRQAMAVNAACRARDHTLEAYGRRLLAALAPGEPGESRKAA
jgi:glycosyltransferase involved in cell wall biosynthesis